MTGDVEKRWSDPTTLRRAGWYAAAVIGVAMAVMVITLVSAGTDSQNCADRQPVACSDVGRYVLVFVPTGILLLGGLGAFATAYRAWRRGGTWPIWHGAGWILLTFMLIYLGMSARVFAS